MQVSEIKQLKNESEKMQHTAPFHQNVIITAKKADNEFEIVEVSLHSIFRNCRKLHKRGADVLCM